MEKLREYRNRLLPRDGVPEEKSSSPRKKEDSGIQMQVPATPHRNAKKPRIEEAKRELVLSRPFPAEDLLYVFCNLIIAGILVHDPDTVPFTFPNSNTVVDIPACVVLYPGRKAPMLERLATIVRGPATKPCFSGLARKAARFVGMVPSPKYFLVERLGLGSTWNVFRAVTDTGHDCVVKLYIREYRYGQKITDFDSKGWEAVSREEWMYHNVYPELAAEHVWVEKLCGGHCLILPFLEPVPKADRESNVANVGALYQQKCVSRGYRIQKEHVGWGHICMFSKKLYLYSLGSVETSTDGVEQNELQNILIERATLDATEIF